MKTTLLRINTLDGLKVLHLLHIRNHLIQTCQTPDMSKVHLSVNSQHGAMTRPATSTDVEYEREQVRSQMRARAARRVVKHACATGAHRHGRSKHHRCHRAGVASQRPARVVSHDRTDAVHACPVKQRVLAYTAMGSVPSIVGNRVEVGFGSARAFTRPHRDAQTSAFCEARTDR